VFVKDAAVVSVAAAVVRAAAVVVLAAAVVAAVRINEMNEINDTRLAFPSVKFRKRFSEDALMSLD